MGHLGPFPLKNGYGTVTAADRKEIHDATKCSVSVRKRGQWEERMVTVTGPISKLAQAYKLALEAIEKNGFDGGRVPEEEREKSKGKGKQKKGWQQQRQPQQPQQPQQQPEDSDVGLSWAEPAASLAQQQSGQQTWNGSHWGHSQWCGPWWNWNQMAVSVNAATWALQQQQWQQHRAKMEAEELQKRRSPSKSSSSSSRGSAKKTIKSSSSSSSNSAKKKDSAKAPTVQVEQNAEKKPPEKVADADDEDKNKS